MTLDQQITILLRELTAAQQRQNNYFAKIQIDQLLNSLRTHPRRLEPFGFKVYSQADEDGILEEIFFRLGINQGTFCEIGVENGLECNTLFLIHKNWTGVWIEANCNYVADILNRFSSIIPNQLNVLNGYVTQENISELCTRFDRDIDFLSIDIDGNDIYIFEALPISPKVICIEYNAKFPHSIKKRQIYNPSLIWKGTDYFGASLSSLCDVAEQKGYTLVSTNIIGSNAFFVRNDLVTPSLFPLDLSLKELYNPPRYYLVFDYYRNIGHRADFGNYSNL